MPAQAARNEETQDAPESSAALTELLDHVAAELAAEYVRLMEEVAEREQATASPSEGET